MPPFEKSVLITGGTAGLGYGCALEIARKHPEYLVVVASRTDPNSAAVTINQTLGQENVVFRALDLSSLDNVRNFVETWKNENRPPLQALVCNAALQFPTGIHYSADGVEKTFAINHLGHAMLFFLFQSQSLFTDNPRIVTVSSGTHDPTIRSGLQAAKYNTAEELAHPSKETKNGDGRGRYTTSKLVNIMWTYLLHRHLNGKGTAVAFDPGLLPGSGLAREAGPILRWLWIHVMPHIKPLLRLIISPNIHSTEESGASLAWVAVDPEVKGTSGVYYEGRKQIKSSVDSYNETKQDDLWKWTTNFCKV